MIPTENHLLSTTEDEKSTTVSKLTKEHSVDISSGVCGSPSVISCEYKDFCEQEGERECIAEDELFSLTPKPELQRIREEQIRQWLAYDQQQQLQDLFTGHSNRLFGTAQEIGFCKQSAERDRRVRFLTDSEGNLLISVYLTK